MVIIPEWKSRTSPPEVYTTKRIFHDLKDALRYIRLLELDDDEYILVGLDQ